MSSDTESVLQKYGAFYLGEYSTHELFAMTIQQNPGGKLHQYSSYDLFAIPGKKNAYRIENLVSQPESSGFTLLIALMCSSCNKVYTYNTRKNWRHHVIVESNFDRSLFNIFIIDETWEDSTSFTGCSKAALHEHLDIEGVKMFHHIWVPLGDTFSGEGDDLRW